MLILFIILSVVAWFTLGYFLGSHLATLDRFVCFGEPAMYIFWWTFWFWPMGIIFYCADVIEDLSWDYLNSRLEEKIRERRKKKSKG